jgi:hypothetical protein
VVTREVEMFSGYGRATDYEGDVDVFFVAALVKSNSR